MTVPPSVALPALGERAAVRVPLKPVARLPYWSSASTSKPNGAPAVRLLGGSVTQDQLRGRDGRDVDAAGRDRGEAAARDLERDGADVRQGQAREGRDSADWRSTVVGSRQRVVPRWAGDRHGHAAVEVRVRGAALLVEGVTVRPNA